MREKSFAMKHFQVLAYPERAGLTPALAAKVAREP